MSTLCDYVDQCILPLYRMSGSGMRSSVDEGRRVVEYLGRSMTVGSKNNLRASWTRWIDYLGEKDEIGYPGEFLQLGHPEYKVDKVILFMAHCYHHLSRREEQIREDISHVKSYFELHGHNTAFFSDELVIRAKASGGRSADETRTRLDLQAAVMKLPMSRDMVVEVRRTHWVAGDWSMKALDKKGIWLAIALGFDSGPRVGNVTLKDGPAREDHCVRGLDCVFEVVTVAGERRQYLAGITLAQYLCEQAGRSDTVQSVTMRYATHKTQKQLTQVPKFIARRTDLESQVLDDLCAWVMHSGVRQTDELLTRYAPRRKVVIRKDVANAIKDTAESFGLPRVNFSTRSLRSGYGTHAAAHGVPKTQLNQRGGWKENSTIPEQHYVVPIVNVGALATGDGHSFTVENVRRLAPTTDIW